MSSSSSTIYALTRFELFYYELSCFCSSSSSESTTTAAFTGLKVEPFPRPTIPAALLKPPESYLLNYVSYSGAPIFACHFVDFSLLDAETYVELFSYSSGPKLDPFF